MEFRPDALDPRPLILFPVPDSEEFPVSIAFSTNGHHSASPGIPDFGGYLFRRRQELGVSRRQLAEKTGLTYQSIRNYEIGRCNPAPHSEVKVRAALMGFPAKVQAKPKQEPAPAPSPQPFDPMKLAKLVEIANEIGYDEAIAALEQKGADRYWWRDRLAAILADDQARSAQG
jgi:transcriptional regulator with XRE-family HTH domain